MNWTSDIKGVIFDIDGVLLDSLGIWKDLGARYLRRIGKDPEPALGEILFPMSMEQGAEYLTEHYRLEQTWQEVLDGIQTMIRDFYYDEVKAKPEAAQLLQFIRRSGLQMAAATSSPRGHVERALERNGLLQYIDRIYCSSEVGSSKHSPEIYDMAASWMGLDRKEICVFEDSLYALRTAADAGYYTVGVYDQNGEPDQNGLKKAADLYIGPGESYRIIIADA